jgi:predicted nucleic acid-binding protein
MKIPVLVLDANILIRAVLGKAVGNLFYCHYDKALFCVPDKALEDAWTYLPPLLEQRGQPIDYMNALVCFETLIQVIEYNRYKLFEKEAKLRLTGIDLDDWPILATALLLDGAVWTHDRDFLGIGVVTWDTQHIGRLFEHDSDGETLNG